MKHLTIILFIITFFSFEVISQSRQKLYTINVYGNGAGGGDSCMRAVNEKYGFKYMAVVDNHYSNADVRMEMIFDV